MKGFRIRMDSPVLVDSAPRRIRKWGHWQFPGVQRVAPDRYEARFHNGNDDYDAYGSPAPCYASEDCTHWTPLPDSHESLVGSVKLPNGDIIKKHALASAKIAELPIDTGKAYPVFTINKRTYTAYPLDALPPALSGYRLLRKKAGATQWTEEIAPMRETGGIRCGFDGLLPAMQARENQLALAPDGSLYMVVYNFQQFPDSTPDPCDRVIFFRSTDGARSFEQISVVPYVPDMALDPDAMSDERRGWLEPAFAFADARRMVCVIRTTHRALGPMYIMRSGDAGHTWQAPSVLHPYGVLPRLLLLDNGVLALSFGRPGVSMVFSADFGETWSEPLEIVPQKHEDVLADSCGYTSLEAIDANTLVLAYSDFQYNPGDGYPRKAVMTRRISIEREEET